jgi:F-type H+-transporting ATPase subunit b
VSSGPRRLAAIFLTILVVLSAAVLVAPWTASAAPIEGPMVLFGRWEIPGWMVLVLRWVNVLALAGILYFLLRGPAAQFFAERRQSIVAGLENGRRAREEAEERLRDVESRLANLEAEIAAMRADAKQEAQAERERILAGARAEAGKILAMAEQEVAALGKAAQMELRAHAATLAVALAEKRIRATLTPERHAALVRDYAAGLRQTREG